MARWSLVVSDETDKALRAFLGQNAAKKGALSAFVEKAVVEQLRQEAFDRLMNRPGGDPPRPGDEMPND